MAVIISLKEFHKESKDKNLHPPQTNIYQRFWMIQA